MYRGPKGGGGQSQNAAWRASLRTGPAVSSNKKRPAVQITDAYEKQQAAIQRADASEKQLAESRTRAATLQEKLFSLEVVAKFSEERNRIQQATIKSLKNETNKAVRAAKNAQQAREAAAQAAQNTITKLENELEGARYATRAAETTKTEKNRIAANLQRIQRELNSVKQQRNESHRKALEYENFLEQATQIAENEVTKRNEQIRQQAAKIVNAEKRLANLATRASNNANARRTAEALQKQLEQNKQRLQKNLNNALTSARKQQESAQRNLTNARSEAARAKNNAAAAAANRNAKVAEAEKKAAASHIASLMRLALARKSSDRKFENLQRQLANTSMNAATAREQLNALNRASQVIQRNRNAAIAARKAAENAKAAGNIALATQQTKAAANLNILRRQHEEQLKNLKQKALVKNVSSRIVYTLQSRRKNRELANAMARENAIRRNYQLALKHIENARKKGNTLAAQAAEKNAEIARLAALSASQNTIRQQRNAEIAELKRREQAAKARAQAAFENSEAQREAGIQAARNHTALLRAQAEAALQARIDKEYANAATAAAKRNANIARAAANAARANVNRTKTQAAANKAAKAEANAQLAQARQNLANAQARAAAAELAKANAEKRGTASNAARAAAIAAHRNVETQLEQLKSKSKNTLTQLSNMTRALESERFKREANYTRKITQTRAVLLRQIKNLKRQLTNAQRSGQPSVVVQQFATTLAQAKKQNRSIYKNMASARLARELKQLVKNILSAKGGGPAPPGPNTQPPSPNTIPPPLPVKPIDIARARRNLMYALINQLNKGEITKNNIRRRFQKPEFNKMINNLSNINKSSIKFRTYGNRMNKILISEDVDIEKARKAYNIIKNLVEKLPAAQNKTTIRDLIKAQYPIAVAKKNELGYIENLEVRRTFNTARDAIGLSALTGNVFRSIPVALMGFRNTSSIDARIRNLKAQYNKASLTNQPKILAQIKQLMDAKTALVPSKTTGTQVNTTPSLSKPVNTGNFNKLFNNARYKSERLERIRGFARLMNKYKAPAQRQKLRDEAVTTIRKLYRNAGYGTSKREIFQDLLDAKRVIGGRNSNVNREISVALRRIEDEMKAKNRGRPSSRNSLPSNNTNRRNIRPLMPPSAGAPPMITYPSAGAAPPAVYPGGAQVIPAAGPAAPPGVSIKIGEGKTTVPTPVIAEAASQIPVGERAAINAAGGLRAVNTATNMGGGAANVTQAAIALNKAGGNVVKARANTGLPVAAFNAVNKLGGANRAIVAVRGLKNIEKRVVRRKRGKKYTIARSKLALVVHKLKRKNINKMVIGWIVKDKPKKKKVRRVRKA